MLGCEGTLQLNRRELPEAIKQTYRGEIFSYEYFWENEKVRLALHSYVVKTKSTGLRNVLLLSTVQPILVVSKIPRGNLRFINCMITQKVALILLINPWALILVTLTLNIGLWQLSLTIWTLVG